MNKNNKTVYDYIEKTDIFGITPHLFINDEEKFRTKFGSFLTFLLLSCVLVACWVYGKDIIYRENPKTTYSEQITSHQQRYDINPKKFNFGVGLQTPSWDHYVDEAIYRVQFEQTYIQNIENENGETTTNFLSYPLRHKLCEAKDFQVSEEYFHSLNYLNKLYCIDSEESEAFIEGDFNSPVYGNITVKFIPCTNSTEPDSVVCKPQEEIDQTLADNYWGIYLSDQILDPKRYQDPFKSTGRDTFGIVQNTMFRQEELYFRNIWLEDNTGIIFDSVNKKRGVSLSYSREISQNTPMKDGSFLSIVLRFEKIKETKVYRTYLNLAEVIANVGGILKILMMVLFVISQFVSSKLYYLSMVNDVFVFKTSEEDKQQQQQQQNNNNDIENNKESQSPNKNKNISPQKLKFSSYFQLFNCFTKNKKIQEKKKLLQFADSRIKQHLNLQIILNKLMEVEKLKMLLLNSQQQTLFSYIPKPVITSDVLQQKEQLLQPGGQYQQKQITHKQRMSRRASKVFQNYLLQSKEQHQINIDDAYEAFRKIGSKKNKKKLDYKILDLMDRNLYDQFTKRLGSQVEYQIDEKYIPINAKISKYRSGTYLPGEESFNNNKFQMESNYNSEEKNYYKIQEQSTSRIFKNDITINENIQDKPSQQQLQLKSSCQSPCSKQQNNNIESFNNIQNAITFKDISQDSSIFNSDDIEPNINQKVENSGRGQITTGFSIIQSERIQRQNYK